MKIRAAVDAASDADILILARTDARAVHGFEEALTRCREFEAEGADIVFLEAPENEDEMRRFCATMRVPCMANMVHGGKTPILPPDKLQDIGFKLAIYPLVLLSSAVAAMQGALIALQSGATASGPKKFRSRNYKRSLDFLNTGRARSGTGTLRPANAGSKQKLT
jgi:2-methylisocitrate lyase-like PEP mutase family enzyme